MTAPRRAFTLLELIVSVGIIALLASLVVVALGGVRANANRTESMNALRGMLMGYSAYSGDHEQQLMPGYIDLARLQALQMSPKVASGEPLDPGLAQGATSAPLDPNDASSYVWRLTPYLDDGWQTMFVDYRNDQMMGRLDVEVRGGARQSGAGMCGPTDPVYGPGTIAEAGCNDLGIGLTPSFGLNSIFVGGDNVHGGSAITERNPWDSRFDTLAATRLAEVKNPARLIVFAPTVHFGELDDSDGNDLFPDAPVSDVDFGYVELRAPVIDDVAQWHLEGDRIVTDGDFSTTDATGRAIGGGVPISRWGKDLLPTGHLDGSVTSQTVSGIGDPFFNGWSAFATGP